MSDLKQALTNIGEVLDQLDGENVELVIIYTCGTITVMPVRWPTVWRDRLVGACLAAHPQTQVGSWPSVST